MQVYRVGPLPPAALAAAATFHAADLVAAGDLLSRFADALVLVFPPADHAHKAWRLAAVQSLAREHAPVRVNAIESADEAAISAALDYLAAAPGVTGQLLTLDGHGAGDMLSMSG